ncbi:ppp1cc-b [Symbiodinium sp. CCMP2456]|nr:ppp1cc-b [Symbiodinium sp. CCMP2456]
MGAGSSEAQQTGHRPLAPLEVAKPEEIRVTVLNLAGREVLSCTLADGSTVRDLKYLVAAAGGPHARLQQLSFGSCVLKDATSCQQLGWTSAEPVTVTMTRVLPDLEKLLASLMHPKCLRRPANLLEIDLNILCCHCKEIFLSEPMLLKLEPPLCVVGNMHGHFDQLVKLLERCGSLPDTRYLFLGGYVGKGPPRSIDTMALLFVYKAQFPENLFLLRGRDEDASTSRIYGFYDECHRRFNIKLWKAFVDVFSCMPVCAVIREKIFCVSSGLSPHLTSFDRIGELERPCRVPEEGLLCDLLFARPETGSGWEKAPLDIACTFGEDVVQKFAAELGLDLIVRSNQPVGDGYAIFADHKLLTLWSIADWDWDDTDDQRYHLAAVMKVADNLDITAQVFDKLSSASSGVAGQSHTIALSWSAERQRVAHMPMASAPDRPEKAVGDDAPDSPSSLLEEKVQEAGSVPSSLGDVRVLVLSLAGREVASLLVHADTTIRGLKNHIATAGGPDARVQVLSSGSAVLEDKQTCSSLGWTADEAVLVTMTHALPDVDGCLDYFLRRYASDKAIPEEYASQLLLLCCRCKEIFLAEPMLLELEPPWVIVGNMHGYYDQLLNLFQRFGELPDSRYLFLGGYVDRGRRSLDTIALLLLRKMQYPDSLKLLRSNHEDAAMTRIYGFYDECKRRANVRLWKAFVEVFNCLPVGALIREKIFCVSGGLSKELQDFDCIRQLQRPRMVPEEGLLCDLMWSDPQPHPGWAENDRGVSFCFGADVVQQFVEKMGLDLIVRSHQVIHEGYEFFADGKLVTLWSIHNFKGELGNQAAIMKVSETMEMKLEVFDRHH